MPSEVNVLDAPPTPAAAAPATSAPAAEPVKEAAPAAPAAETPTDAAATPVADPAAPVDAAKDPAAPTEADPAKPAPTSIVDDDSDAAAYPAKPTDAADADKDAKPAPEWADLRMAAIDRQMAKAEASLKKSVSAADLPKELAKLRTRMETQLGRYGSVEDALLAGWNAQEKLRSGKVKEALAEDASPEEVAEWRQANGVPDAPEKYEILPIDGHKWTDADAPALARLKEAAHAMNMGSKEVNGIAALYAGLVQEAREAQQEKFEQLDRNDVQAVRDTLRDQFKGDYKPSITLMKRMLEDADVFPDELGGALAQARLPNGSRLINNPAIAKFLIETARERYGEGAMISGGEAAAFQSEKSELEALMGSDISAYQNQPWKSSGKTGSERYMEILREEQSRGRRR